MMSFPRPQSTISLATALNPYISYPKPPRSSNESITTGETIIAIARKKNLLPEEQIIEILGSGSHD